MGPSHCCHPSRKRSEEEPAEHAWAFDFSLDLPDLFEKPLLLFANLLLFFESFLFGVSHRSSSLLACLRPSPACSLPSSHSAECRTTLRYRVGSVGAETILRARRLVCIPRSGGLAGRSHGSPAAGDRCRASSASSAARVLREDRRGWTARLTVDDEVAVYCPDCDQREFGEPHA
jgi:hypothetical protein